MVLPVDDHMVHRGHGVFDTAHLQGGALHMLDRHLDRFLRSMVRSPMYNRSDTIVLAKKYSTSSMICYLYKDMTSCDVEWAL